MREYVSAKPPVTRRSFLRVFGGYHHRPVIDAGEWYDMENLTSDAYPLLCVRPARQTGVTLDGSALTDCIALHERSDHPVVLCKDGSILCGGHTLAGLLVTENGSVPASLLPKQVVSMGARCIVFPDKVWFDAVRLGNGDAMTAEEDYGSLDCETRVRKGEPGYLNADLLTFTSVYSTGTGYTPYAAGTVTYADTPPEEPENGALWCDTTSLRQARMMAYDAAQSVWIETQDTYVRLTAADAQGQTLSIGAGFSAGDGIELSGLNGANVIAGETDPVRSHIHNLNGHWTVEACSETWLVLRTAIGAAAVSTHNASIDKDIVFARRAPDMDFAVSCGNRLWGCRYGVENAERINEIYACKLGDFKNWQSYQGIATDSYAASRGAEGEFTGAAVLGDTPLFFREHSFEKVYPDANGAHQIVTVNYPGIGRGSSRSAKVLGSTLFYLGTDGVYAYAGSVPQNISYRLGDGRLTDGAAGVLGEKYYLSAVDEDGKPQLFVFDTRRGLWHREDSTRFLFAACFEGALYITDGQQSVQKIGGTQSRKGVRWMAESGLIGLELPEQKRIARLILRLQPDLGADVRVLVEYDSSGVWHEKCRLHGSSLHTASLPIVPVRCDHLRLKLEGIGGMRLYSIAYHTEQGSDVP